MVLQTVKADSGMQTVTPTKEYGCTIRQTDTDFTSMQTGPVIWDTGKTMCKTEGARKRGQMDLVLKGTTWMARNMGRVFTIGPMGQALMEAGVTIKSTDTAFTNGLTVANLLVTGKTITCMASANMSGQTAEVTMGIMKMTKSTDTASTHGQTVASTRASG